MTGKTQRHHAAAWGRTRWYIVLVALVFLLVAAAGYYIGQQSEPAPSSGSPAAPKSTAQVKRPQEADAKVGQEIRPSKQIGKKGRLPEITSAADQNRTASQSDQVRTETGESDPQMLIAQVVAALDDPNPRVRQEALERLESVDHPAVNVALSKALSDTDEDVREAALDVMSQIESPNILDSLAEALSHGEEDMREEALDISEEISDPRTVDILIEKGLLNDNAEIQEGAFEALETITDQIFTSYQEARQWWDENRESFQFDD